MKLTRPHQTAIVAFAAFVLAACGQVPDKTGSSPTDSTPTGATGIAPEYSTGDLIQPEEMTFGPTHSSNRLQTLAAGQFRSLNQIMPVNVVMLGYDRGGGATGIDESRLRSHLPQRYETFNRDGLYYTDAAGKPIKERIGIKFRYRYNLRYTDRSFEDRFFAYLSSIAVDKPLTLFQTGYNCQFLPDEKTPPCAAPAKTITKPVTSNAWIDGPKVERWLSDNGGGAGIDTSQPTVFLVNWYGRSDFKFHVYTKTDEPDPDTGYNFGALRSSRKMIAWGGTGANDPQGGPGRLARVWFHDLSAGPEAKTDNWDITNADVDADKIADYRMPPVWEYGSPRKTYRKFNDLSGDLGKIVRNVAINLLFTTSPVYRPAITPTVLPETVWLNLNVYQGLPGFDGKALFQTPLTVKNLTDLQPQNTFRVELTDRGYSSGARAAYECVANNTVCYPNIFGGYPGASLFVYNLGQLPRVLSNVNDYQVPIFAYSVDESVPLPFLGLADDDYATATQSLVYAATTPAALGNPYGFTTTIIHEVGHHLGMSHPHDGYDAERDTDYGPSGPYYYAWAGDESNSMMSYIDVNWDFSQFDQDNMNRYLTATYINQANLLLKRIYDENKAGRMSADLIRADTAATQALHAYWGMRYPESVARAKDAYDTLRDAARRSSVDLDKFVWYENYEFPKPAALDAALRTRQNLQEKAELRKRNAP
jgi:hypothetical protein